MIRDEAKARRSDLAREFHLADEDGQVLGGVNFLDWFDVLLPAP